MAIFPALTVEASVEVFKVTPEDEAELVEEPFDQVIMEPSDEIIEEPPDQIIAE